MTRLVQRLAATLLLSISLAAAAQAQPAQAPAPPTQPAPGKPATAIEKGSTVKIEYTLTDGAGAVLDTNKGQDPLIYTQGEQQIIPGLERELFGMRVGQEKKVMVKPEDGYGDVNPAAQTEVPKGMLPADALRVGTQLMARTASGDARPVVVKEVKEDTVVLDLNHPLAGKTLYFDVKVLGVDPPKASDSKPGN